MGLVLEHVKKRFHSPATGIEVTLRERKDNGTYSGNIGHRYETILICKSSEYSFQLNNYPYFCGGIFLSGIVCFNNWQEKEQLKNTLLEVFKYAFAENNALVNYVTNNQQTRIITLLEEIGFQKVGEEIFNPNSGNKCQQWTLDLNKL